MTGAERGEARAASAPGGGSPRPERPTITASAFTSALSLAANGVSIVTSAHGGRRAGLTVSSMCSVCAEPALLLACVNADNEFCAVADAAGHFAVNILGAHQRLHSNVFAGLDEATSADRFATAGEWTTLASGAPILSDALVALDCELDTTIARGTHRIFLGRVVDVRTTRGEPLVYSARGYAEIRLPDDIEPG